MIDVKNMKKCTYVEDRNFDVVFLDGGEYTTYLEYQVLKDNCKMIICDDCCVDKCSCIYSELKVDPSWELLYENFNERNGWCAFQRSSSFTQ